MNEDKQRLLSDFLAERLEGRISDLTVSLEPTGSSDIFESGEDLVFNLEDHAISRKFIEELIAEFYRSQGFLTGFCGNLFLLQRGTTNIASGSLILVKTEVTISCHQI